jgi:hypothetical protein
MNQKQNECVVKCVSQSMQNTVGLSPLETMAVLIQLQIEFSLLQQELHQSVLVPAIAAKVADSLLVCGKDDPRGSEILVPSNKIVLA